MHISLNDWDESCQLILIHCYSKASLAFSPINLYSYSHILNLSFFIPKVSRVGIIIDIVYAKCDNTCQALLLHGTHGLLNLVLECQASLLLNSKRFTHYR